jgi:6-pyruvoyltetrahydropterin/6-carboxytetrahydropterin synthase
VIRQQGRLKSIIIPSVFRLAREVRLSIPFRKTQTPPVKIYNGHAGYPAMEEPGQFFTVQVSLAGEPDPESGYVVNIQEIDAIVRSDGLPILLELGGGAKTAGWLFEKFGAVWPNLASVRLGVTPYTAYSVRATEHPMVRFSHRFEFSAAHRLHNPKLDAAANAELFGKCNNPNGHGHNYELEVTVRASVAVAKLERIVSETIIRRFDHKFLNLDTAEFAELNPTVENIAQTIYRLLKPKLEELVSVTVWETPKTWCEYWE